jgi:hypothetical protein
MVLLLHHLESKSFTYRDTQLSRFKDLAALPPVLPGFERTGRTHRVHRTSAGAAHTFSEAAPNGGFGVWRLCPPNPALAGNACRWCAKRSLAFLAG